MKITGNGFLSNDGLKISSEIVRNNLDKFEFLEFLLNELRKFVLSREIDHQETEEQKQKIISLVVTVRLLEITEAALLIMKHGMNNEANSIFRIFLDAYFIIANIYSEKSFVSNYFNSDTAARLKLLNTVEKHDTELFKEINEYASKELKNELKDKISKENIQAFSSYAFASNVGCEEIYDSMYRMTSASLHSMPRSLENYVEEEDGIITSINYHPIEIDIPQKIYDYSYFIIKVISGLKKLFGELSTEEIRNLFVRLEDFEKSHNKLSGELGVSDKKEDE